MRRGLVAIVAGLICLSPTRPVSAHSFDPAVLDIVETTAGRFHLSWRFSAANEGSGSGSTDIELPSHCRIVATTEDDLPSSIDCGERGLHGQPLVLSVNRTTRVDLLLRLRFLDEQTASGIVTSAAPVFVVPGVARAADAASTATLSADYAGFGAEDVVFSFVHVVFVLGLLLIGSSPQSLLTMLTAFVLGYSVTLALAVVDVARVPFGHIDVLIPLSIMILAAEMIREPQAASQPSRGTPWSMAFIFGLLHGFRFANELRAIGLPAGHVVAAVLFFNLGIAIGQLGVVLAATIPVDLWRQYSATHARLRGFPAYVIGSIAAAALFDCARLVPTR